MKITAIKIDAYAQTVTRIEMGTELQDFYAAISCRIMECIHPQGLKARDGLFVDEEGLLKPCERFFIFEGYPQHLAGNGVIVGADEDGETVSCETPLEVVKQRVAFLMLSVPFQLQK